VAVRKPDPGHLLAVVEALGEVPTNVIMVGDSQTDVSTARAAGIPVVAVSFGYSQVPAAELGADALIDHFSELPAAIAGLGR
jgi:phosphoglycolate phosphatase